MTPLRALARAFLAAWLATAISAPAAAAAPAVSGSVSAERPILLPAATSRLWQTQLPFWGLGSAPVTVGSPFTFGVDFSVDGPFTAVQLILANPGAALTVQGVLVAASASIASRSNPVAANGASEPWTTGSVGGVSTNFVLPAGTLAVPSMTATDPIPLESLSRTDGGVFALIYTRLLVASGAIVNAPLLPASFNYAQYSSDAGGREVHAYQIAADYVTQNQSALTDATLGNYVDAAGQHFLYVAGVRYLSPTRQITIMGAGDSLTAGALTTSSYHGFGLQAAVALSKRLGIGVAYEANGYPGAVTSLIVQNALNTIAIAPPTFLTLPIDSPNDYTGLTTPAAIAAQRVLQEQRMLGLADTAMSKGIVPVVLTPIPFSTYDYAVDFGPSRQVAGALVRELAASGTIMLDAQAIISGYVPTPTHLQVLPAVCIASDNAHLDDLCQGWLGGVLADEIAPHVLH